MSKHKWHGKVIGNNWYVHKKYIRDVVKEFGIYDQYLCFLSRLRSIRGLFLFEYPYTFDVVKLCVEDGVIVYASFIKVVDFDAQDEPVLEWSVKVKPGLCVGTGYNGRDNPPVYHHKWMMVRPDYEGFDYKKSQSRSHEWVSNPTIAEFMKRDPNFKSRIGYKSYWDAICKEAGI